MVKVLIVRFSSIGDIVLTTPVVRAVKNQLNDGDVEVHFITKKSFESVLANNPYIDRLWTIEKHVSEVEKELSEEGFDYVFDLHNNLRSRKVSGATKALTFRFDKLNLRKWWYVNTKVNVMPDMHIVDRYLDVAKSLGVANDGRGLDYFISDGDEYKLNDSTFNSGFVAWAIGGNHEGKKLPLERMKQLVGYINYPLVLLGGKEDYLAGEEICESTERKDVLNLCGSLRLGQSASLVSQSRVVLTHDTGLMHIASAFEKPIVSIWGATVPEFGMSPYLPAKGSAIIEPKGVRRPYSKLGNKQWYKPAFKGMEKIDLNEIVQAIDRAWAQSTRTI